MAENKKDPTTFGDVVQQMADELAESLSDLFPTKPPTFLHQVHVVVYNVNVDVYNFISTVVYILLSLPFSIIGGLVNGVFTAAKDAFLKR